MKQILILIAAGLMLAGCVYGPRPGYGYYAPGYHYYYDDD